MTELTFANVYGRNGNQPTTWLISSKLPNLYQSSWREHFRKGLNVNAFQRKKKKKYLIIIIFKSWHRFGNLVCLSLYDEDNDDKIHRQEAMLGLENLIALFDKEDTKPEIPNLVDMIYERYAGSFEKARNFWLEISVIVKECVDIPRLADLFDIDGNVSLMKKAVPQTQTQKKWKERQWLKRCWFKKLL